MRFYFTVTDEAKFKSLTASFNSKNLKFKSRTVDNVALVYLETPGLPAGSLEAPISVTVGGKAYTYDYRDYMKGCGEDFKGTAIYLYTFSHFAKIYQAG